MSDFTKTIIIDNTVDEIQGERYKWIQTAIDDDINTGLQTYGGTIIVERSTYIVDGTNTQPTGDRRTVSVPSNVAIISHGATIQVTADVEAFKNADASNERIVLDGFKVVLNYAGTYSADIISLSGVSNCEVKKLYFEALTPMSFMTDAPDFAVNGVIKIDGTATHPSYNNIISFCSLKGYVDISTDCGSGAGVRIKGCTKNTIARNNFIQYFNAGIYAGDGQAGNVVGTIIRGNACTDAKPKNTIETRKGLGILAWVANGSVIVGNSCQGSYGDGLYLSGFRNVA
jgi:hypothetical protein